MKEISEGKRNMIKKRIKELRSQRRWVCLSGTLIGIGLSITVVGSIVGVPILLLTHIYGLLNKQEETNLLLKYGE